MASQEHQEKKYDVFVSFRGEDVRYGFLSHLSAALRRKKIMIFIDDKLEKGEMISESLVKSIEDSKLSIIIFSENFASSTWCLEEVAEIIRCRKRMGQIVVPVFYHVDPSHVRKQSGNFGDAFAGHEKKHNKEKVEKWRSALTKAGNISGWHQASATTSEHELVEDIVRAVLKKLNENSSGYTESLVGMDSHIKQMESLLCVGKDDVDVRTVGIWGMGGIGKTTLAEAIFHRKSSQFEDCCFLANVREEWEKYGRASLQGKFLSALLEDENPIKASSNMGRNIFIRDRLRRSKFLIVLDDVSNVEQLESVAVESGCFGLQSRIIITTRDKQVLQGKVDEMYEIGGLSDSDALQLFNQHAFKGNYPTKDFEEFSKRVVKYANGNPLALKVIGAALLFKSKKIWESALNKLEKSPPDEIQVKLRISYDALDKEERRIFLDIVCFFKGDNTNDVTRILDGCGFHTQFGLSNLVDKSLIYVCEDMIWIHDLLQQMGRAIVFDESEQPGKRSRLWIPKEASDVLRKNKGTEAVEGIILDLSSLNDVHFPAKTFERMEKLRVLKIYDSSQMLKIYDSNQMQWYFRHFSREVCKVHLSQGLDCLPEELRCLWWHKYPLKSLPSNFNPENLVDLDLRCSDIEELWNGLEDLPNLKFLCLGYCQRLINTPDFSVAPNLLRIILEECTTLLDVHPSIWALDNLIELNMSNCKEVRSFLESIHLKSLKTLKLSGCSNLMKFPEILEKMECLKELYLDKTAIEEVPSSIENLTGLWSLDLESCKRLKSLPNNICQLKSLEYLDLSSCSELGSLPSSIWQLNSLIRLSLFECSKLESLPEISEINKNLAHLYLSGTSIRELPSSIGNLIVLDSLDLRSCKRLKSLPRNISKLESLKSLDLYGCSELESLPSRICQLNSLTDLHISDCSKLGSFPEISEINEQLEILRLDGTAIKGLPSSIDNLTGLDKLYLNNCKSLATLPSSIFNLKSLVDLDLHGCSKLQHLPCSCSYSDPSSCNLLEVPLRILDLRGSGIVSIPPCIKLSDLRSLYLENCHSLQSLSDLPPSIEMVYAHNCTQLKTVTFPSFSKLFDSIPSNEIRDSDILDFNFTNCLELDQEQRINIQEEAVRLIKSIATPVLELRHQQGKLSFLSVVLPESEFAGWFSNQSMGSSVTVQLPPDWFKYSFMEFSVCALLECKGLITRHDDYMECKCTFNNEFGNKSFDFGFSPNWRYGGRLLKSDHLLLGYGALAMDEWPNKCYTTEASFQFSMGNCKVKRCGVRLVTHQVKNNNNPTVMERSSSSDNCGEPMVFHYDCSEEPHPKKLKLL